MQNFVQDWLNYANNTKAMFDNLNQLNDEGIDVAHCSKEVVYTEDKLKLYKFAATQKSSCKTPLLINYALVNRYYMMDLQPDKSLIKNLLDQGISIYLIDWGYPDYADKYLDLDDYINGYMNNVIGFIKQAETVNQVNILGVCQGGTFSVCYSAINPDSVKNLITMVTPIDFHTPDNLLSALMKHIDIDEAAKSFNDNIPGDALNNFFSMLKPVLLNAKKHFDMPSIFQNEKAKKNFLRMEKWINDSPDQATAAYVEFIKNFFQDNKLIKNEITIGDQPVNLKALSMPILNVYASQDHLVPPSSSQALKKFVASKDYEELSFEGGHIGIYVSSKAQKTIPTAIAKWLQARD